MAQVRHKLLSVARPKLSVAWASSCDVRKGVVVGAYKGGCPGEFDLTDAANKIDSDSGGRLSQLLKGSSLNKGQAEVFCSLSEQYYEVAVAGLGRELHGGGAGASGEAVRRAAAAGANALSDRGITHIDVEAFSNAECAAEGALLAVWRYQELRDESAQSIIPKLQLYSTQIDGCSRDIWKRGQIKAECQNMARKLEETPANLMSPSLFAQAAIELLCPCGLQVEVKGRDWLEATRMTSFLSVARGSCEPPMFIQINYCGTENDVKPIVLVGKGVTFDTGSLNLKNCGDMSEYRADMAGAAVVLATLKAAAQMNLPINVKGLIPLCENGFGGLSMKPGDVVVAMNGKTIRLEDTDREGRVVLADALSFAGSLKPCLVINIANLGTGLKMGMGEPASGVFSTSDEVWEEMNEAGREAGDRFWRFPLWNFYSHRLTDHVGVDVSNVGKSTGGDPCLAAAFLMEFAPPVDFVHIDVSGTGLVSSGKVVPYLRKGLMSGRPVRALAQLLHRMACPHHKIPPE